MKEKFWNVSTGAHHKASWRLLCPGNQGGSEKAIQALAEINEKQKDTHHLRPSGQSSISISIMANELPHPFYSSAELRSLLC